MERALIIVILGAVIGALSVVVLYWIGVPLWLICILLPIAALLITVRLEQRQHSMLHQV